MCTGLEPSAIAALVGTGVSVVGAVVGAEQARKNKPKAPEAPAQAAKAPDVGAMSEQNRLAATLGDKKGQSSTLLTGASGVDAGQLNLGRSTLLGQ